MSDVDPKPYKIDYAWPDYTDGEWDGSISWATAEAESPLHAADILHRLGAPHWQVRTLTADERWRDCTGEVHHILIRYVQPCYQDGRSISPDTFKEARSCKPTT